MTKKQKPKSPYMTVAEAAEFLRRTPHTIHTYCRPKDGKPAILTKKKMGGFNTTLLLRSEVEALVQDVEPEAETEHGLTVEEVEGPHGPYPSNRIPAQPKRRTGAVTTTNTLAPDPYEDPDPA